MKISTRTRYGMRAMVELAWSHPGGTTSLKGVAQRQFLSVKYLERIFSDLKCAGLVTSLRGNQGGYALSRAPEETKLIEIFSALEGPPVLVDCTREGQPCPHQAACPTTHLWRRMTGSLTGILESTTLADLARGDGGMAGLVEQVPPERPGDC